MATNATWIWEICINTRYFISLSSNRYEIYFNECKFLFLKYHHDDSSIGQKIATCSQMAFHPHHDNHHW